MILVLAHREPKVQNDSEVVVSRPLKRRNHSVPTGIKEVTLTWFLFSDIFFLIKKMKIRRCHGQAYRPPETENGIQIKLSWVLSQEMNT
jgi:hypothetical protein